MEPNSHRSSIFLFFCPSIFLSETVWPQASFRRSRGNDQLLERQGAEARRQLLLHLRGAALVLLEGPADRIGNLDLLRREHATISGGLRPMADQRLQMAARHRQNQI